MFIYFYHHHFYSGLSALYWTTPSLYSTAGSLTTTGVGTGFYAGTSMFSTFFSATGASSFFSGTVIDWGSGVVTFGGSSFGFVVTGAATGTYTYEPDPDPDPSDSDYSS